MTEDCRHCRYWQEEDGKVDGECHRYPPTIDENVADGQFPRVPFSEWCGEWRR